MVLCLQVEIDRNFEAVLLFMVLPFIVMRCYYSQPIKFEDFWHDSCQKYEFFGAILHDFLQNVCISALKALLVTMSGVAVNSNNETDYKGFECKHSRVP